MHQRRSLPQRRNSPRSSVLEKREVLKNIGERDSVNEPLVCAGGEAGAGIGGGDARVVAWHPDWDDSDVEVSFFSLDI